MASQVERRERTRARLIEAAADCFEKSGYVETSIDAVLLKTGVSKGALYHHFVSKTALLEAVFIDQSNVVLAQAGRASTTIRNPREALLCALKTWLRAVLEPRPRRILLEIGPGVLGFYRAREIERAQSEASLRALIVRTMAQGEADCADIDLSTRLLNAGVTEMALTALDQDRGSPDFDRYDAAIDTLIAALIPPRAPVTETATEQT